VDELLTNYHKEDKMKTNRILIVLAFVFTVTAGAFAQEVQIKDETPFTYASLECAGSYNLIPAKIGEFMGEFFKQGLIPMGSFFGLYFNSPAEVKEADLKWSIGFPIQNDATVKEPLKKAEFKYEKVAYYLYKGPVEKVGDVYPVVFKQIAEKGYAAAGPVMENYLDDPNNTKPEDLRTEIIIPVAKK
jgi:effector-binding domain-containing protein